MPGPRHDPQRDRALAARPRNRPRHVEGIGDLVDSVIDDEARRRMRRFGKAVAVLKRALPAAALAKLRPVDLRAGTLTLAVEDGPLLAELRQHHHHALLAALVEAGSGITEVRWRLMRR